MIEIRILSDMIPMTNMQASMAMLPTAKMKINDLCSIRTVIIYKIDNTIEQQIPTATIHKYSYPC